VDELCRHITFMARQRGLYRPIVVTHTSTAPHKHTNIEHKHVGETERAASLALIDRVTRQTTCLRRPVCTDVVQRLLTAFRGRGASKRSVHMPQFHLT